MSMYGAQPANSCAICGRRPEEDNESLQICQMCNRRFCSSCTVLDFGREFCSVRCRDLFFYGDDEDGSEDD